MTRVAQHNQLRKIKKILKLCMALVILVLISCNPAKRVEKGQYLLKKNVIVYRSLVPPKPPKSKLGNIDNKIASIPESEFAKLALPPELSESQLEAYIKQKPNTKILGLIPLHLLEYNLVDPEMAKEKRLVKNQKIDEKNKRIAGKNDVRIKEGKKPRAFKSKEPKVFSREWLMGVGEAPVILDSNLMSGSLFQITKYLHTKGYFDGKVGDSVHISGNRAEVIYIVRAGKPYKIRSVKYQLDDTSLAGIIYKDTVNSLMIRGDNFDEDILKAERDRMTKVLKDNGYYAFSKEYIDFDIDTNRSTKVVGLTVNVKKYAYADPVKTDSVIETEHHLYMINRVIVQMGFNPSIPYVAGDTTLENGYVIVGPVGGMAFLPKILLSKIYIKPGDLFRIASVENTYAGLNQMKQFRYVNIRWLLAKDSNKLDCFIQLMPNTKQSFSSEVIGDNTGGFWGAQADGTYQNNNLLKGAEVLQVKLRYALQAQTLLPGEQPAGLVTKSVTFNTQDIGPEVGLLVPRPLNIFKLIPVNPSIANPQTSFKVLYDFQIQPDYQRDILTLSYGYDWNCWNHDHINITLFEMNFVSAITSQRFRDALRSTNDFFLENSFKNQLIPDSRITWIFNNQNLAKLHNYDYIKISLEGSGVALMNLVGHEVKKHDTVLGVPLSHYVKGDIDYRHFIILSKDDKLAFRAILGAGIPLLNDAGQQLPFDKSFWAGGSNDIRAWTARTLGPGANSNLVSVEQIGDIKMEVNV